MSNLYLQQAAAHVTVIVKAVSHVQQAVNHRLVFEIGDAQNVASIEEVLNVRVQFQRRRRYRMRAFIGNSGLCRQRYRINACIVNQLFN